MTTTTRSSSGERRRAARASADRHARLRSIETTLLKARLDVDSIDEPVLAYFIDLAIADVLKMASVDQEPPVPQDGRRSNVIRFANSPAKVALPAR